MSFILDALKKVEENRHDDSVPDITTIHAESSSSKGKRHILTYLLISILLINAVVLAAWLRPQKNEMSQNNDQETIANIEKPAPAVQSINEATEKIETALKQEVIESPPAPDSAIAEKPSAMSTEKAQMPINPSPEEITALKSKIAEEQIQITSSAAIKAELDEESVPASEKGVLRMSQLPISIKERLPDLTITGHIYSNDPLSRLVNINGNIIREGGTVTEGLRVNEITTSGVILDYGGLIFSLKAF